VSEKISNKITREAVIESIKTAIKGGKPKNFTQTVEVGVNFVGINFKQPGNRLNLTVSLPNPVEKKIKVLLFAKDMNLVNTLKPIIDKTIMDTEIPKLDKKNTKILARDYNLFFAEPSVMAIVGKHLGQVLAPRGKMPKPAPQNINIIKAIIEKSKQSIIISNRKGKSLPTVHFPVGKENFDVNKIYENFSKCLDAILNFIPGKMQNIKSIYIKKTMGPINYIYKK